MFVVTKSKGLANAGPFTRTIAPQDNGYTAKIHFLSDLFVTMQIFCIFASKMTNCYGRKKISHRHSDVLTVDS